MFLDKIIASTKRRVAEAKAKASMEELAERAKAFPGSALSFEGALRSPGISFICEVKRASPSKGLIAEEFDYLDIAKDYEAGGARAVSVLTEPDFFMGEAAHLREIAAKISIPCLRKDFIVDEYQIYEAKIWGASAVLLIVAALTDKELSSFLEAALSLGLAALTEAHTEEEVIRALQAGASIVGVNNRDLKTFEVDINTCLRLRGLVPRDVLYAAESGIRTRGDVIRLEKGGCDAVLVGESLMRAKNRVKTLEELRGLT